MKFNIYSLRCVLFKYKPLLENKLDFEKHLSYLDNGIAILKDVEINSLEELIDLFSEFEDQTGYDVGEIVMNLKTKEITILDSYIE
jgi:hypothetical protein